ncbi:PREDICTED: arf-GAP with SH3 domain, ANK repeat and PH domain-containing protein 2 isoform X2 [Nicrophorus vespilloides]|uniref:Arf-GAP with SH3 domain, ANK repeat and PH domain-containing protein 2 isoform X2 n=1 Tax=Nicrophorus vespilloides TaxID=110193 RepID=A0ABM1MKE0_NICVS|nr:PREDICTED: arf-GAP with SH3 domain, ANK repeat and PH domain-containing protein 2 isoform X2 [Nicrophorus vespilloides]
MPTSIKVSEFIDETHDDLSSPTTSSFVSRMPQYRNTIAAFEETLDFDRDGLLKMKKAIKAILTSGATHIENEEYLARALEKIGHIAVSKDQETDIGAAFIKFSVVSKELSALMKTLMQNLNNIVMFPLETLLKGDLRGVKGDLKRPFDKAWKDYESKYIKIEKEKKQQAKDAGMIRTEVTGHEIADEMEKERKLFQLQMCEYLIKFNDIETKKGIDLLQNLVKYYHAQTNYFQDGLKTIEHFGNYVADLSVELQKIRQKQDDERRKLNDLRGLIRAAPSIEKEVGSNVDKSAAGYSLHQLQGDKHQGYTRSGHLLKKSEGKMRRVWQKRKCKVKAEGYLEICHADESKPPTRVNLLTCQIKIVPEDKRGFDLISYNRTYHFQAEDEHDQHAWMSVLVNCRERALMKAFDASSASGGDKVNHGFIELQQTIIRYIQRIPGNDHCCDCDSKNDATWLSTNFGIIVCIECSGIHRDLGVHISRIQSLTLDNLGTSQLLLARHMTNQSFNDIMEAKLPFGNKPTPSSSMEERFTFIREKYVDKRYSMKTRHGGHEKLYDLEEAINSEDLGLVVQTFAENVDLMASLPTSDHGETALHRVVMKSGSKNLAIVDFLVQNMNSTGIDKQTLPPSSSDISGCNTALHICALYDKTECMKLLLRCGADTTIRNSQDKTPMDIAQEMGHRTCQELLQNAVNRQKHLFDNINIEWNLSHDDGSTDFSDDDTIIDDRNGSLTPEKKNRSRPPSYTGGDSPITLRSRSSTCDSLQSGSSPNSNNRQMPPPPPPQSRKPVITNVHGSLKKRVAPLPPSGGMQMSSGSMYGTLPSSHSRTPSDPVAAGYHTLSHTHKRSPSSDSSSSRSVIQYGNKLVMPIDPKGIDKLTQVKRPLNPPPPAPSPRLSNGRSNESISSMVSDLDTSGHNPIPPPRRASDSPPHKLASSPISTGSLSSPRMSYTPNGSCPRRCKALYDCNADNDDELSFQEGEIIVVINENTDDENWMEGVVENEPDRRGMFPLSFVHMLHD